MYVYITVILYSLFIYTKCSEKYISKLKKTVENNTLTNI